MIKKKYLIGLNIVLLGFLFVCCGSQSECYAKMNNSYYFNEVAKYYGIYDTFINTNSATTIQNFENNISQWNGCIIKFSNSYPPTIYIDGVDYYVDNSNGLSGTYHSPKFNKEWYAQSNNNYRLTGSEYNSNTNVNYNVNKTTFTYQFIIAPTNSATGRLKANQTNGILIFNLDTCFGTITQGYIDSSIPDIFQIGTSEIGLNIDNNAISYRLYSYDEDLQQKIELNQALTSEYISEGLSYNYEIYAEKQYLSQTGSYALYYVLDNNEYLLDVAYIIVENSGGGGSSSGDIGNSGTITNVSGDKTGNIDLSGIENRQDATNQKLDEVNSSINNLPNEIEDKLYNSGENKGIVQKIYDDLFTYDEEEVKGKINTFVEENLPQMSGEIVEDTLILEKLKNKSGDFIISWNDVKYNDMTIVEHGEINFSQIERENEVLTRVMMYERIILTITLISILLKEWYKTILACFGVDLVIFNNAKEVTTKVENTTEKGKK